MFVILKRQSILSTVSLYFDGEAVDWDNRLGGSRLEAFGCRSREDIRRDVLLLFNRNLFGRQTQEFWRKEIKMSRESLEKKCVF